MSAKVTVYYDGLCVLCSREIDHYRRQKGAESLQFVDITSPEFSPEQEGLDPFLVHKVMHVKNQEGELRTGVEAFMTIWQQLPRYRFAAELAKRRTVRSVLELGYKGFVRVRPYLPRKSRDCESSPYCDLKEAK